MIDDTSDFFDLDDFAEAATLNGKSAAVIFDRPRFSYQEGFSQVVSNSPQVTCQTSDVILANVVQGSTVVFRNRNYTVTDVDDNGAGISILSLHEAD